MEQSVIYCPRCGTAIKPGTRFCPKCGTEVRFVPGEPTPGENTPSGGGGTATVTRVTPQTVTTAKGPGKKGPIIAIAAVALVLVLVIVGVVAFHGRSASKEDETPTAEAETEQTPEAAEDEAGGEDAAVGEDAEAENTYIGYLDKALNAALSSEETCDEISEEHNDENADTLEEYDRYVGVYTDLYDEIEGYRSEAADLGIGDKKLLAAGDMIFNTAGSSMTIRARLYRFFRDFFAVYYDEEYSIPYQENYTTYEDYYYALRDWYDFATENYGEIEYPSCITSEWERYLADLTLNQTVLNKLAMGLNYGDPLRIQSAMNLAERYITQEELDYQSLMSGVGNETEHSRSQFSFASSLVEEARDYVALDQDAREEYEFEDLRDGTIRFVYDAIDTIYPSLYNTYDAFVLVKTGCINGTRKIVVEAEIPGFTQKYREVFSLDASYKGIYIKPPALAGDVNLTSAKDAQLTVTLSDMDGGIIDAKTFPVTIKSLYDVDWYSDEYGLATQDNVLCYLAPESASIAQLKRLAIDQMSSITGGAVESFVGYQDIGLGAYATTYLEAAGIMRALYESGVRYLMDPYSISGSNQHVLLPDAVLEQQGGLCVETSLVVASALQSAGMHAFLIFPPGHAQVAVEVWNSEDHIGEYFLIETTALDASSNNEDIYYEGLQTLLSGYATGLPIEYMSASDMEEYLQGVDYIVDCDDAAVLGMTPFAN